MASSVSVCVCDCPCVSGWASSCSPPQDVHKSIAPERAKLLAHLTLDCFFVVFFFVSFWLQLLGCYCTGDRAQHCTKRRRMRRAVTRRQHIYLSVCVDLRVLGFFLFLFTDKAQRQTKKKTKLELAGFCFFISEIFFFWGGFVRISHPASMNLLLVQGKLWRWWKLRTELRPKIASYWLAPIHLARMGTEGKEGEREMRVHRMENHPEYVEAHQKGN